MKSKIGFSGKYEITHRNAQGIILNKQTTNDFLFALDNGGGVLSPALNTDKIDTKTRRLFFVANKTTGVLRGYAIEPGATQATLAWTSQALLSRWYRSTSLRVSRMLRFNRLTVS